LAGPLQPRCPSNTPCKVCWRTSKLWPPPLDQADHPFSLLQSTPAMRFYIYTPSSVLALLSTAVALECYYPDGKIGSGLVPCNTTASVTHCCRKPDVCLTNGLCYSSIGSIIRRGCTDKTWNSTECPSEICTTGRPPGGFFIGAPITGQGKPCKVRDQRLIHFVIHREVANWGCGNDALRRVPRLLLWAGQRRPIMLQWQCD